MAVLNEVRVQAMRANLSLGSGTPSNLLELLYVQGLGGTANNVPTAWREVFDAAGVTGGGHNERFYKYLATLGHTDSTLPQRERAYWVAVLAA